MPKSLIVYFSQGGTTANIANGIASGLKSRQSTVDLCNLKDAQPPSITGYELLGIGSPVYYFRPPSNVMDYINNLPDLKGVKFFLFMLHGTNPFDAVSAIREALLRKGAQEIGFYQCYGADFFLGYLQRGYLFSPNHPTKDEIEQSHAFGRHLVDTFDGGRAYVPTPEHPAPLIYRLERFLTSRWLIEQVYSRLFRVNPKKCISCGLCMKLCPTKNIHENKKGRPVWERNCLLCLTCEMKCPVGAITSAVGWQLFLPFIIYNVRHASKDSSLDYKRVKFSKGRVHES